jgi:pimeloyl-ACP methyl ester carboxylesterase
MPMVEVNGAQLAYEQAGAGPAVVLTHAGVADRRMWAHQFRTLAAEFRVTRWDSRGYGRSGDAAGAVSHHRDLLGLLDALDIERAALVGCSQGGMFSLDVALAEPARVGALVLIGSGLSGHEWPASMVQPIREAVLAAVPAERMTAYAQRRAPATDADIAAIAAVQARFMVAGPGRDPSEVDGGVWATAIALLEGVYRREWSGPVWSTVDLDPPAAGRLGDVRAPTLVINGLADVPAIQQVAGLLTAGIPGARRLDLPATGHLPPLERPAETTAAIRDFLAGLRNPTP